MRPELTVRPARTSDVPAIKSLVDRYAGKVLLGKDVVTLYEHVQGFRVAELDGAVVGCGALHVLWADIAEIRTVAVHPDTRGHGIGGHLVRDLIHRAATLGVSRVFVLTFETAFFARHGFTEITGTPVDATAYHHLRRSHDEGTAQFLDLPYVKPNTLGNTRMLLDLTTTTPVTTSTAQRHNHS